VSGSGPRGAGRTRPGAGRGALPLAAAAVLTLAPGPAAGIGSALVPVSTQLLGVACPSTTRCVAVGAATGLDSATGLVETWDGRRWTAAAPVRVPGYAFVTLSGVACVAATCIVVGYAQDRSGTRALVLVGRGRGWSAMRGAPAGSGAELLAVACATARSCLAVGSRQATLGEQQPLAERWNGRSWSLAPPVLRGGWAASRLDQVACAGVDSCAAVGSATLGGAGGLPPASVAEWWRPSGWTLVGAADPVAAVACPAALPCLALGTQSRHAGQPVLLRSAGGRWTPTGPSGGPGLIGVDRLACAAASACLAVGARRAGGAGDQTPSAASWTGAAWTPMAVAGPVGGDDAFDAVACPRPRECVAVGLRQRGAGELAVAARWNGATWTWPAVGRAGAG